MLAYFDAGLVIRIGSTLLSLGFLNPPGKGWKLITALYISFYKVCMLQFIRWAMQFFSYWKNSIIIYYTKVQKYSVKIFVLLNSAIYSCTLRPFFSL